MVVSQSSWMLAIEAVSVAGSAVGIEFRVKLDYVEVWHRGRCAAVIDRDVLAGWLAEPFTALVIDDVTLTLDHSIDVRGRVAITLPDVNGWALSPHEEARLHTMITGGRR